LPTQIDNLAAGVRNANGLPVNARRFMRQTFVPVGGLEVYARWMPYNTITFDPNGGGFHATHAMWNTPGMMNQRRLPTGWTMANMETLWGGVADHGAPIGNMHWMHNRNAASGVHGQMVLPGPGHTFMHWATEPDGSGVLWMQTNVMPAQDITLYAQWAATVSFNNNHSTINPSYPNTVATRNIMLGRSFSDNHAHSNARYEPPTHPMQRIPGLVNNFAMHTEAWPTLFAGGDRAFMGWNSQASGGGYWFDHNTVINGPVTYFAIWGETLSFLPGAAPADSILEQYRTMGTTIGQALGEDMPPDPTWYGQVFRGWQTIEGGSFDEDTIVPGAMTLIALWNTVVTFNNHGHGPAVSAVDPHPVGEPVGTLRWPGSITRSNWSWSGWENATGQTFTANTPILSRVELHARWDANITWALNSAQAVWAATGAEPARVIRENGTIGAMTVQPPTRPNYSLTGWNSMPDGSGVSFAPGMTVPSTGHTTFYAQWGPAGHNLTLRLVDQTGLTGGVRGGQVYVTPPGLPTGLLTTNNQSVLAQIGAHIYVTVSYSGLPALNREWFRADIALRNGAGAIIPPPASMAAAFADIFGDGTAPAPPASVTLQPFPMPTHDLVVYITFSPRDRWGLVVDDLHFGQHPARIISTTPMTLQTAFSTLNAPGATNPANVNVQVFNGTGGNWTLEVYASAPVSGSDDFARMLVVNGDTIFGDTNSAQVSSGNGATILQTINWLSLDYGGVAVLISTNSLNLIGSQQAVLNWNLIAVP